MTPDSNGILYLEETDPITPFQTTINALQAATSAAILDAQIWEIPGGRIIADSNQTIPHATVTNLTLSNVVTLRGGMTVGSSGLVVPRDGWYTVTGSVRWGTSGTGTRQLRILHNGSIAVSDGLNAEGANRGISQVAAVSVYCEAGDAFRLAVYQSSGGDLDTSYSPTWNAPHLTVVWNGA